MGSRNSDGTRITQSNNILWQYSRANAVKTRNSTVDEQRGSVTSSGIDVTHTTSSGVRFMPDEMTKAQRTADHSQEYLKFTDPDGNFPARPCHKVTRAEGIHVSISNRVAGEVSGVLSTAPMRTMEERKVFFTDDDRNLAAASQSDWTIFDATGIAVTSPDGTTDTDITPHDT